MATVSTTEGTLCGRRHPNPLVRDLAERGVNISALARMADTNRALVSEGLRGGRLTERMAEAIGEVLSIPTDEVINMAARYRASLRAGMQAAIAKHPRQGRGVRK